eukprot:1000900-Alexandrium_andersonii.AAC.1
MCVFGSRASRLGLSKHARLGLGRRVGILKFAHGSGANGAHPPATGQTPRAAGRGTLARGLSTGRSGHG